MAYEGQAHIYLVQKFSTHLHEVTSQPYVIYFSRFSTKVCRKVNTELRDIIELGSFNAILDSARFVSSQLKLLIRCRSRLIKRHVRSIFVPACKKQIEWNSAQANTKRLYLRFAERVKPHDWVTLKAWSVVGLRLCSCSIMLSNTTRFNNRWSQLRKVHRQNL